MIPLKETKFIDDPLDTVELIASLQNWTCERSDNEVSIIASGKHNNYQIAVSFHNNYEGLNIICGFDLKFNSKNKNQILELVSSINSQIWLGHFDIWDKDGLVIYRNSSFFDKINFTYDYIETLLLDSVNSIDRYFPAFQYILWAGKSSEEALNSVLFETKGEA